jgi:hypothetical protein
MVIKSMKITTLIGNYFRKRPSASRSQQRSSNSGANLAPAASEDATKKFGNAKSISSDQYFCGNTVDVSFRNEKIR